MKNKIQKKKEVVITGKKTVSSPLILNSDATLVIAGELTIGGDEQELTEKENFAKHFGKTLRDTPQIKDELDELLLKIFKNEDDRSIIKIWNIIRSELGKEKIQKRKYDNEGILLQWVVGTYQRRKNHNPPKNRKKKPPLPTF